MKRFDKGFIFSCLLSDLFTSFVLVSLFANDILFDSEADGALNVPLIPYFVAAFFIIYICFVIYRILYYKTSGYELTQREIKCRRGVLFRKNSVLDYQKIHAINKKQNIIHKLFGIAVLTVDSGSTNTAQQAEIVIFEKADIVDTLLNELHALRETGMRTEHTPKETVLLSEKDSLYHFTSKRKLLYTAANVFSAAFFTVVLGLALAILIGICNYALRLGMFDSFLDYLLLFGLILVGASLLFSLFSCLGSVVQSFVGYYNFIITKRDHDLEISYGLLNRHTNAFAFNRIKGVKISQGPVQRMLGFASIKLEVIGYVSENGNNGVELGVLVPFCKYSEVNEILAKVLPDYVPDERQTKAVSYFPFISWFSCILGGVTGLIMLITALDLLLLGAASAAIPITLSAVLLTGVLIFAITALDACLCYKNSGLAIHGDRITAYHGGYTRVITVFLRKNLIAVEDVTTPLRKKAGITTLVMHLGTNAMTNEVKVQMQSDSLVTKLEDTLIL